MDMKERVVAPTANWEKPARTWIDAIDRYLNFVQIPSWRVNPSKLDGRLSRDEAEALRPKTMQVLNRMAARRSVEVATCAVEIGDLGSLTKSSGRDVPKAHRCSKRLHRV